MGTLYHGLGWKCKDKDEVFNLFRKKNEAFQVPGFAYYFDGTNAIINERTMMIRRSKWLILHFEFHRTM